MAVPRVGWQVTNQNEQQCHWHPGLRTWLQRSHTEVLHPFRWRPVAPASPGSRKSGAIRERALETKSEINTFGKEPAVLHQRAMNTENGSHVPLLDIMPRRVAASLGCLNVTSFWNLFTERTVTLRAIPCLSPDFRFWFAEEARPPWCT